MSATSDSMPDKDEVRRRIEELAKLSKELEANARMQAAAPTIVAAEQLKKRVVELSEIQAVKMRELVQMHPDKEAQERYAALSKRVEEAQGLVRAAKEMTELRRLEAEIETSVNEYVHHFQTMVSQLMGAPPPDKPVFG